MIVCVRIARFELVVAAGGPQALSGRALALAPQAGAEQRVGEVSGAAEGFGVHPGMSLGEALARCPKLELVAPDPLGVEEAWERVAVALESIGATVELEHPGIAYFDARGLRGLHGGYDGVLAAARGAVGRAAHLGAGPTRFCALAAALRARARRPVIVAGNARVARDFLSPLSVGLLRHRAQTAMLVEPLTRLGVLTLGELARMGRDVIADRFGPPGLLAQRLARGGDVPLATRVVIERLEESLELEESASGPALERALGMLIDRLLARPERRGRTLRAAVLAARLVEGGTWRERVVFREALGDPQRMRLALGGRLALLPSPAHSLRLSAERFGPSGGDQHSLLEQSTGQRRARLHEAIRQTRAVAGPDAALRALCVDPDSRVPERRVVLTPFEG